MDLRGKTAYPLGLRNNNPGNLRPTGTTWQGQVGTNSNFMVFSEMKYGTRALGTDLSNKYYRGLNTIRKIINVYAPPSENNTEAYISAVSNKLRVMPDTVLVWNRNTLFSFMRAVMEHENGASYANLIPDSEVNAGIDLMSSSLLLKIQGFLPPTRK